VDAGHQFFAGDVPEQGGATARRGAAGVPAVLAQRSSEPVDLGCDRRHRGAHRRHGGRVVAHLGSQATGAPPFQDDDGLAGTARGGERIRRQLDQLGATRQLADPGRLAEQLAVDPVQGAGRRAEGASRVRPVPSIAVDPAEPRPEVQRLLGQITDPEQRQGVLQDLHPLLLGRPGEPQQVVPLLVAHGERDPARRLTQLPGPCAQPQRAAERFPVVLVRGPAIDDLVDPAGDRGEPARGRVDGRQVGETDDLLGNGGVELSGPPQHAEHLGTDGEVLGALPLAGFQVALDLLPHGFCGVVQCSGRGLREPLGEEHRRRLLAQPDGLLDVRAAVGRPGLGPRDQDVGQVEDGVGPVQRVAVGRAHAQSRAAEVLGDLQVRRPLAPLPVHVQDAQVRRVHRPRVRIGLLGREPQGVPQQTDGLLDVGGVFAGRLPGQDRGQVGRGGGVEAGVATGARQVDGAAQVVFGGRGCHGVPVLGAVGQLERPAHPQLRLHLAFAQPLGQLHRPGEPAGPTGVRSARTVAQSGEQDGQLGL
jgi:hypothetical protein